MHKKQEGKMVLVEGARAREVHRIMQQPETAEQRRRLQEMIWRNLPRGAELRPRPRCARGG